MWKYIFMAKKRGGTRPGAGRPVSKEDKQRTTIYISADVYRQLKSKKYKFSENIDSFLSKESKKLALMLDKSQKNREILDK